MQYLLLHIAEEGIFGGTGYLVIRALGFGRVRSDYASTKLLRICDGCLTVGWFFTNVVGVLFWIGIAALAALLLR
jgi:hypothetical protein